MDMETNGDDTADLFGEIENDIEEAFSGFHRSLFDLERKSLQPLCKIEMSEENVRVIFDLPLVDRKEDLVLSATEDTLNIEAKIRNPVSLMVGGPYQRNVEFEKYIKQIRLPTKVDPEKARARLSNGLLVVEFPLNNTGRRVRIE
jgi:HSP20 family protein